MLSIAFRPRAKYDLEGIAAYLAIELGMPQAAQKKIAKILEALDLLAELPETGRLFSSSELEQPYRKFLVESYWIYYTHNEETLTVWRIFHASRDMDQYAWLVLE